jgi:hypothetical protein
LRRCWLDLDRLRQRAQASYERGQEFGKQLQADHRAALDELVDAGELDAGVAEQVQSIYVEAVYHIWRSLATCYEPVIIDYTPAARGQLIQQTELLSRMATERELDPATLAQAQAALERDIAFLTLPAKQRERLYDKLLAAGAPYPSYHELDLAIDPSEAKAALFLVALFTEP